MSSLIPKLFSSRQNNFSKLFTPIMVPNIKTTSILHRGKNYKQIPAYNFEYLYEYLNEIYSDKLCYMKKDSSLNCLIFNEGNEKYNTIFIPKSYIKAIMNCKKRFIFFYIKIDLFELDTGIIIDIQNINNSDDLIENFKDNNIKYDHIGGHINVLVFDTLKKEAERYEPHGYETIVNLDTIDKILIHKLKSELGYKYFRPIDFCPNLSLQSLHSNIRNKKYEDKGYCMVWSTWYMECRLLNPDEDRNILINRLSSYFMYQEDKDKFLHTTIYNYWTMLRKYIELRKIYNLSPSDTMDKLMELNLYDKKSIKYTPKLPQIKIYN